jgi:lipopolysaccharide transport system ATP-binding protein
MSSDNTVISVRNLTKSYNLSHQSSANTTIREAIISSLKNPFKRGNTEEFQALKDVSFDVQMGDVVGVVGRNGAGKSTLLKVLSRITAPTKGEVRMRGRVGSLLEVGTGFHPELTGRENIYLNGAILGMSHREIAQQFDAIVDFSGTERFLDTPIKRYSSGMSVRLAFAVAAHLDPEILIVDEVLAVGDAEFQKKCLGKMHDVAKGGRTILFVSHNMGAVSSLCTKAIFMQQGQLRAIDKVERVIDMYMESGETYEGERFWPNLDIAPGDPRLRLSAVRVRNQAGETSALVGMHENIELDIEYQVFERLPELRVAFRLIASDGTIAFTSDDYAVEEWQKRPRDLGTYRSTCSIPGNLLNEGRYTIMIKTDIPMRENIIEMDEVIVFHVEQMHSYRNGVVEHLPGAVYPVLPWRVEASLQNGTTSRLTSAPIVSSNGTHAATVTARS